MVRRKLVRDSNSLNVNIYLLLKNLSFCCKPAEAGSSLASKWIRPEAISLLIHC
ncbi:hypothetical protein QW060_01035 [Myroides ceti]|uniref:Uncharacterized protein n=1 Tax=Paenimyroides ceti TaxID=395087 RepID=A0ABT8CMF6_9FLAO|nr:hypothetical protein [Paenimyroides ceti]MDN3705709.1 hypothetical protein [Paenimyroides ceti]